MEMNTNQNNETSEMDAIVAGPTTPPFLISVGKGAMTAHLILLRDEDGGKPITSSDVKKELHKKNIVFGIKKHAIESVLSEKSFYIEYIIAEGEYPARGTTAQIEPKINIRDYESIEFQRIVAEGGKRKVNAGTTVKKGDVLLEKTPSAGGAPGKDIHGNPVVPATGTDSDFSLGDNVEITPDGLQAIASIDGVALSADGKLHVLEIKKEIIEVIISKDHTSANLVLSPGDFEKPMLTEEEITKLLDDAGVKFGIRENIKRLLPSKLDEPVEIVVATGMKPIHGAHGRLKILDPKQENEGSPYKADEDGNVNFREKLDTGIVRKGSVVGILIPPTSGKDGITVTGEPIPTKHGKVCHVRLEKNVEFSDDGQMILATRDGKLISAGNMVRVDEFLQIDGDVGYGTGNITFDGTVAVSGDLLPGFSIAVTGDVDISGVVDAGSVTSDRNIRIRGAVYGNGKTQLKAKGDIWVKSAIDSYIEAGGNIEVDQFIRNCSIIVDGDLKILHDTKGHIFGGKVVCGGDVITCNLGSMTYIPTTIELGANPKLILRREEILDEIEKIRENMDRVDRNIRNLKKQSATKAANPEHRKLMMSLTHALMTLHTKYTKLDNEAMGIEDKLRRLKNGTIQIIGTLYPGVIVRIGYSSAKYKTENSRLTLSERDDEIVVTHF